MERFAWMNRHGFGFRLGLVEVQVYNYLGDRIAKRIWEVQIAEPTPSRSGEGFAIAGPVLFSRPLTTKDRAVREAQRVVQLDVNHGFGVRAINVETGEEVCVRDLKKAWAQRVIG